MITIVIIFTDDAKDKTNILPNSANEQDVTDVFAENTVYITETGGKYHRADCYTIKGGGVPVSKEEAEELGKEPCKVCRP